MLSKWSNKNWLEKVKLLSLGVVGAGTLVGVALASYWSHNYFGLKKLPDYIPLPPVDVNDLDLHSIPFKMNYRVLNLDKCV